MFGFAACVVGWFFWGRLLFLGGNLVSWRKPRRHGDVAAIVVFGANGQMFAVAAACVAAVTAAVAVVSGAALARLRSMSTSLIMRGIHYLVLPQVQVLCQQLPRRTCHSCVLFICLFILRCVGRTPMQPLRRWTWRQGRWWTALTSGR